jgi:DNA polymerase kappa
VFFLCKVFTRAKALDHWISKKEDLFSVGEISRGTSGQSAHVCFQIGKNLLLPELPLKLRLIGLRVTKLKDLRASESTNGIKRVREFAMSLVLNIYFVIVL